MTRRGTRRGTRRRKQAYEALHPAAKHGENQHTGRVRKVCEPSDEPADRFTADTAKAERAFFTQRRKEAYEALHPEAKHGENQHTRWSRQVNDSTGGKKADRKVCDEHPADRFTTDTAKATGQSERKVQRDTGTAGHGRGSRD